MGSKGTGLLSLPPELLRHIANLCLNDDARCTKGPGGLRELDLRPTEENSQYVRRRTICGLRLTSKALYDAASHALVPVLRIGLTDAALARAEEIASNGNISAGVTAIEFILPYAPGNLANSLAAFNAFKTQRMHWLEHECARRMEALGGQVRDYDANSAAHDEEFEAVDDMLDKKSALPDWLIKKQLEEKKELRQLVSAVERWEARWIAWSSEPTATQTQDDDLQAMSDRKLLQRGFERFQKVHKEQHHLLTTGTFAVRAGLIASKLPNLSAVHIKDVDDAIRPGSDGKRTLLSDEGTLAMLAEPESWFPQCVLPYSAESVLPDPTAAALLWDLPITIHRAGIALKTLAVYCYPGSAAVALGPGTGSLAVGTQDDLRQSVSSLETFQFVPIIRWEPSYGGRARRSRHVVDWLGMCVSGARLRHVKISLAAFEDVGKEDRILGTNLNPMPVGDVLRHLTVDCLQSVCIERASLGEDDVVALCSQLGARTMSVSLLEVYLHYGRIRNILHIVQGAVGHEYENRGCSIHLSDRPY